MKVYSVFDKVGNFYCTPFFCVSDAVASRMFGDAVLDPNTNLHMHPGDYDLYCLGTFDDAIGLISPCNPVCFVAHATSFLTFSNGDKNEIQS